MPRPNGVGDFGRWLDGTVLEGENRDPFSCSDVSAAPGGVGQLEGGETGRGDGATVEESGTEREREREKARGWSLGD